jgi:hypothetical protein
MGVSPSTKETTLHHFRDPLVELTRKDPELELVGVALVGSPGENSDKAYVARRVGMMAEAMNVEGVLIHLEGFGNQHVDFAAHMEAVGSRGIPVVGLTYQGNGLVVENEYMEDLIDLDKTFVGMETEVVEDNAVMASDVVKAIKLLKKRISIKRRRS